MRIVIGVTGAMGVGVITITMGAVTAAAAAARDTTGTRADTGRIPATARAPPRAQPPRPDPRLRYMDGEGVDEGVGVVQAGRV